MLHYNVASYSWYRIENDVAGIGVTQQCADQIALAMEHKADELYLEIGLDDNRCIHSYLLLTFEEKNKRHRKFSG